MHKTKKKTAKIPKPIKVKKEKSDEERLPQPMVHYVDDRLELVKQIFGSLKPKTIVNLAPQFLKSQGLEEIEEACLNELLCISTKRLKAIIAATKCPTDTESSEDEDVQRQEEHVSLEEISSDSEIEGGSSKKAKKKKPAKAADVQRNGSKTDNTKSTEGAENSVDGQISVLELLELQARARAIRSQLALEPVTKIEVDSDNGGGDEGKQHKNKKDRKTQKSADRKRLSNGKEASELQNRGEKTSDKEAESKNKKIKLKRNYRNTSSGAMSLEQKDHEPTTSSQVQTNNAEMIKPTSQQESQVPLPNASQQQEKGEPLKRSPSPDVIPIVLEPETLLINDSSDEAQIDNMETADAQACTKSANVPIIADIAQNETMEAEEGELIENAEDDDDVNNTENAITSSIQEKTDDNNVSPDSEKITSTEPAMSGAGHLDVKVENTSEFVKRSALEEEEDHNDDVISLGEDLEDEMNEQLEKEESKETFKPRLGLTEEKSKKYEADTSSENQSWHSRYMKSSKVSKVLAASRLGKRVRDKIKKSKTTSQSKTPEKDKNEFTSKHEDGSLEQYRELLELRGRKSK